MKTPDLSLVAVVRKFLDALAAINPSHEDAEKKFDSIIEEFRELPKTGLVEAVDRAAGRNKKRRSAMVFLLSELAEEPQALVLIESEMRVADARSRHVLLQTIGDCKIRTLAPLLNDVMLHDSDDGCRDSAIWAASRLKMDVNFQVVLALARRSSTPLEWRLLQALVDFGRSEAAPILSASFFDPRAEKSDKVWAAWGLGKFHHPEAVAFLKEMLFDKDTVEVNCYTPGESLRATQALCDIYGLPFESSKAFVEANRDRLAGLS